MMAKTPWPPLLLTLMVLVPSVSSTQNQPSGPSFDCVKATTKSELLICRDPSLAVQEKKMADMYSAVLQRAPLEQAPQIRHSHYEWFIAFRDECNSTAMMDEGRASCISFYLDRETQRLLKIPVRSPMEKHSANSDSAAFLSKLKELDVKSSVISEINEDLSQQEAVIGYEELDFKRKIVFTNHRIISVSTLPLVGMNTEWSESGGIVFQGGNFQIRSNKLAYISFVPTRIKKSQGALGVPEEITDFLNKYGPEISKSIWPFELQLVSPASVVLNRFYGIKGPQAEVVAQLAQKAHVRIFMAAASE